MCYNQAHLHMLDGCSQAPYSTSKVAQGIAVKGEKVLLRQKKCLSPQEKYEAIMVTNFLISVHRVIKSDDEPAQARFTLQTLT